MGKAFLTRQQGSSSCKLRHSWNSRKSSYAPHFTDEISDVFNFPGLSCAYLCVQGLLSSTGLRFQILKTQLLIVLFDYRSCFLLASK